MREARKFVLELIISDHPLDCMTCEATGDCRLQDLAYEYAVRGNEYAGGMRHDYPIDDPNPFIQVDRNKCILCLRCVRACDYVNGVEAIGIVYRGFKARISFGMDSTMEDSPCEFCGSCVEVCPTAALWPKMSLGKGRSWQLKKVETTCSYCGVGCQLNLHVRDNHIVRVTGANGPANHGFLCVKGRFGYDYVNHPDRLSKPLVRRYLLEGGSKSQIAEGGNGGSGNSHELRNTHHDFVETDWDTALNLVARKLADVKQQHGGDAIATLASARCTNEENFLLMKLARQVMQTHNIDHCARFWHSSTVTGLVTSFGSGAMTNPFEDIAKNAHCLFIIGSNTTEQHPVFGMQLRQAVKQRGVPLIVADPRRIPISQYAMIHLRHQPGTDTALLNGLMHVLIAEDLYDHEFVANRTEGFEDLRAKMAEYTPERVAAICGVPADDIRRAARIMAANRPGALMYAMGITQHTSGHGNVVSCANLQMLLGNMGVPGGGVNPLRGQSNVQGACDVGGLPNYYSGYQNVALEASHKKFEAAWGMLPPVDKPGLTLVEMMNAAERRQVKAMYIVGENPALSDPDSNHVRHCLQSLDFLVVQDLFLTETAQLADVVLPGASFAEKDGTFTNSERRVQYVRRALNPLGESRSDWEIIADLGQRMTAAIWPDLPESIAEAPHGAWDYLNPAEIMDEIADLTPSYGGIRHHRLEGGHSTSLRPAMALP